MKKIKIPTDLTTLAYDSIKRYILEGRLDQEGRLTEKMLSEQLGISRSPIREALNSLATEHLITIEPRRGASFADFLSKKPRIYTIYGACSRCMPCRVRRLLQRF